MTRPFALAVPASFALMLLQVTSADAAVFTASVITPKGPKVEGPSSAPLAVADQWDMILHDGCCYPNPSGGPDPVHSNHSYDPNTPDPPGTHVSSPSTGNVNAAANAGPGTAGASVNAALDVPDRLSLGRLTSDGSASASFILEDVIISGTGPQVPAELLVTLSGALQAGVVNDNAPFFPMQASASISVIGGYSAPGYSLEFSGGALAVQDAYGNHSYTESGVLTGWGADPNAVLPTGTQMLPVGVAISMRVGLTASVGVTIDMTGSAACCPANSHGSAVASFANTLSLPTDGPVFVLPPGYTVNSVSGHIVDNHWTGPSLAVTPTTWGAVKALYR